MVSPRRQGFRYARLRKLWRPDRHHRLSSVHRRQEDGADSAQPDPVGEVGATAQRYRQSLGRRAIHERRRQGGRRRVSRRREDRPPRGHWSDLPGAPSRREEVTSTPQLFRASTTGDTFETSRTIPLFLRPISNDFALLEKAQMLLRLKPTDRSRYAFTGRQSFQVAS